MNQRSTGAHKNSSEKRDFFLLPRRKETEPRCIWMVHKEQPFNPSKETRWTSAKQQDCKSMEHKNPLPRKGGFLLLLPPCKMQYLFLSFVSAQMWIRLDSHSHNSKETKRNSWQRNGNRVERTGRARRAAEREDGGEWKEGLAAKYVCTSMVASGALLRRLRWLRTCR
jgi:hypothetical protein